MIKTTEILDNGLTQDTYIWTQDGLEYTYVCQYGFRKFPKPIHIDIMWLL